MAKFHLIGIKGAGMSALAQVLHDLNHQVQGSDVEHTFFTQLPLEQKGIPMYPFHPRNIDGDMQVIASNAFQDDHVEIETCRDFGLSVKKYHHFLGEFIQGFTSIAVTGAHGKTTTSGLLAHVLQGIRPTSFLIGDGTGSGKPNSNYFVFESCEYRRHFLAYRPDYAIITNIDYDHPDYFQSIEDVRDAFEEMSKLVRNKIVACGDDPQIQLLQTDTPILTYGFHLSNDLRAECLVVGRDGVKFQVYLHDSSLGEFVIPMYGRHSVLNALAVIGICMLEDLNMDKVRARLASFQGVKRRFAEKQVEGNIVIDDYAHHPSEIRATIEAVRAKYPQRRVVSVFQPHTYSRLAKFMDQFAQSLSESDEVFLCPIFGSAREKDGKVTIEQLLERIPKSHLITEDTIDQLTRFDHSVLLFMGAGDVQKYQASYEAYQKTESLL